MAEHMTLDLFYKALHGPLDPKKHDISVVGTRMDKLTVCFSQGLYDQLVKQQLREGFDPRIGFNKFFRHLLDQILPLIPVCPDTYSPRFTNINTKNEQTAAIGLVRGWFPAKAHTYNFCAMLYLLLIAAKEKQISSEEWNNRKCFKFNLKQSNDHCEILQQAIYEGYIVYNGNTLCIRSKNHGALMVLYHCPFCGEIL